jgi:hypothetical protein
MDLRNCARMLALGSLLGLALIGLPAVQRANADGGDTGGIKGTAVTEVGDTGGIKGVAGVGPVQCATTLCGIRAPRPVGVLEGNPNLQMQITGTPLTCYKYYPTDPDVCAQPIVHVSIHVTNAGSEASPTTKLWWQFGPTDQCCGVLNDTRAVPSLQPGQSEDDSWTIDAFLVSPGLPYGSCQVLAIRLNPTGGNPSHIAAETEVCNNLAA